MMEVYDEVTVVAVGFEIAESGNARHVGQRAVSSFRGSLLRRDLSTGITFFQDDVDDTANSVGAVYSGGAVF